MTYLVVESFTIETPQGSVALLAGKMLELSEDQAAKMGGKVRLVVGENRHLSHYSDPGELRTREQCRYWKQVCHAVGMYQDQCTGTCDSQCKVFRFLELNAEHHQAAQDAPQAAINAQVVLSPASRGEAA
jgi:hypothetical protein